MTNSIIKGATDFGFPQYTLTDYQVEAAGTKVTTTLGDIIYSRNTTDGIANNFTVVGDVEVINKTPSIIDVVGNNVLIKGAQNGVATVGIRNKWGEVNYSRTMNPSGSVQSLMLSGFADGSLRKHLFEQVRDSLSGVTPKSYAQQGARIGNSTNPNIFLRFSKGLYSAPANDILDQMLSGGFGGWKAWVTPHHYLTWRGHSISDTATSKQINGEIALTYSSTRWNGTLAKMLPPDYDTKISGSMNIFFPCFAKLMNLYDGNSNAVMPAFWGSSNHLSKPCDSSFGDMIGLQAYQYRRSDGAIVTGGDSGSPVFCFINGQLVILGCVSYAGQFGSYFYANFFSQLQGFVSAMNASGNYQIATVDLSGFGNY